MNNKGWGLVELLLAVLVMVAVTIVVRMVM